MGTSTRWSGPVGDRWAEAGRLLARWQPDPAHADAGLEVIAEHLLSALHESVRADPSAFRLYDTARTAGGRLADAMDALARARPASATAFVADLTRAVGGDGGTLADAAVRRAAAVSARKVLERHPDPGAVSDAATGGGGLASDILCDLYRLFFAGIVAEFLRSVIAEQLTLSVPVLVAVDPDGRIVERIAEQLVGLVPSPCEEATAAADSSKWSVDTLPETARRLVPRAINSVLGLGDDQTDASEGPAT